MSDDGFHLLITGATGQVGHALAALDWGDWRVTALSRESLDLSDIGAVRECIRRNAPDMIINAAAYTAVDRAESDAAMAFRVNAEAPAAMAEELERLGGVLIHYSTDYVFDGTARRAYRETDAPAPPGVYGASKLAGEAGIVATGCDHLILRTGWVYSYRGANFLLTMLRLAKERDELRVVDDQRGTPTFAVDLATLTARAARQVAGAYDRERLGLYHVGNGGETTWYGFAREIMARSGNERVRVLPIKTSDYPTPAQRPAYSVLDKSRFTAAFGSDVPHWVDGLERCLARLRTNSP